MRKLFFLILFLFFFPSLAHAFYEIDIDTSYVEYDLSKKTIIMNKSFSLSYDRYKFEGDKAYIDLNKDTAKIVSGRFIDGDLFYSGDIQFKKGYLEITNGKMYRASTLLFAAKRVSLYPEEFISGTSFTFYGEDGVPIFGIPYYARLLFFKDHDLFPRITLSKDDIKLKTYIDYYNSSSSFGFFSLDFQRKKGFNMSWNHYISDGFGIIFDYNWGDPIYGISFQGPLTLSFFSDLSSNLIYVPPKDSILKRLSLKYSYIGESGILGTRVSIPVKKVDIYTDMDYTFTKGKWDSLKIGIAPQISPFRLFLDYDFVKKEVGFWIHLDI